MARLCRCGCGTSLVDRRQGTVWATASCESAFRRGVAPAQRRKPSAGGLQLSYAKAVAAAAHVIYGNVPMLSWSQAKAAADEALSEALSEKQRQRLVMKRAAEEQRRVLLALRPRA